MLQPKRRKYRKDFRGRRKGLATRGTGLAFGEFGLKALGRGWMTANQLEAARRTVTNDLKRKGRVWIRVFPDKPVSARGAGQRMGGGKGDVSHYVSVVTPGRIILEIAGVSRELAQDALTKSGNKLPFRSKMVVKEEML